MFTAKDIMLGTRHLRWQNYEKKLTATDLAEMVQ